jgi:hypothetical protein
MTGRTEAEHFGDERRETAEQQAEGIVREELPRLGWQDEDLGRNIISQLVSAMSSGQHSRDDNKQECAHSALQIREDSPLNPATCPRS